MTRRELFRMLGVAIATPAGAPARRARVHFSTHIDTVDADSPREAAVTFLWSLLVERYIDPVTRRADMTRMEKDFRKNVSSWIDRVESVPVVEAGLHSSSFASIKKNS